MAEAIKTKTNAVKEKQKNRDYRKTAYDEEQALQLLEQLEVPADTIDNDENIENEKSELLSEKLNSLNLSENINANQNIPSGNSALQTDSSLNKDNDSASEACNSKNYTSCKSSGEKTVAFTENSQTSPGAATSLLKESNIEQVSNENVCESEASSTFISVPDSTEETSTETKVEEHLTVTELEVRNVDPNEQDLTTKSESPSIKGELVEESSKGNLVEQNVGEDERQTHNLTLDIKSQCKDELHKHTLVFEDVNVDNAVEDEAQKGSLAREDSETCEFPSAPLSTPERTSIQKGLYKDLTTLVNEATTVVNIKPLTDAQLDTLYHNYQLKHNQQYVHGFLQEVKSAEKHEFYEILLGYYRARNQLAAAQHDIEVLKADTDKLQDLSWQGQEFTITAQGECVDKAKVSTAYKYEKQVFSTEHSGELGDKLKDILNLLHDHLALSSYESQFSRLQVEVYLYRLFEKNPSWMNIAPGTPVTAHVQRDEAISVQLAPLRTCISILFAFQRKPVRDTTFLKDTHSWLNRLVSTLLCFSCLEDHIYLVNQVLRCPAGVAKWASQFIQPIPPPPTFPGVLFGHPLLDHYVNMLAMLLMPIRDREKMLHQLRVTMTPPTEPAAQNPWILVDSDGEEDEDPSNSWHFLQENDLVNLLNQLPLSAIYRHVLGITVEQDGSENYPQGNYFEEGAMLKLFALSTTLITIVKKGLDTYSITRYRQLNKRLARIISHVMGYVSDHLEKCRIPLSLCSSATEERIQVEFDNLFFKAASALVSANRLGAWQFLADLPYEQVSESAIWNIFWKMHLSQESEVATIDTLTTKQCIEQIRDPDNLHIFEDRLVTMATSEALYLLTTFANMANSRPENTLFVQTVALEIYQIAYLDTHTREFCSRQGRELLSSVCYRHPQIVSNILPCTRDTLSCIGKVAVFLYSGLPLWLWKPSAEDLSILQKWLVEYQVDSVECHLARKFFERLNWGKSPEDGNQEFLAQSVHYFMMAVIAGAYIAHLTGYQPSALFKEKPKKGLIWGGETDSDVMAQWLWDMAVQLHINRNDNNAPVTDLPDINTDNRYISVSAAKEKQFGIASYFLLLATKCGHSVKDFCCDGLECLETLTVKEYMVPAIRVLSVVLPLAYAPEQHPRLVNNPRFKNIVQTLLNHDECKRQMFSSVFPGHTTKLFSSMIQKHLEGQYEHASGTDVVVLWIQILTTLSDWSQNRDILFVLENVLRPAYRLPGALEYTKSHFKKIHKQYIAKTHPQGVLTTMTNWLSGNIGVQPIIDGHLCADYPWVMYHVILAETEWENETQFWHTMHEEICSKDTNNVDPNVYKTVLTKLKLGNAPPFHKIAIYRLAEQIVAMDVHHRLLPVICQSFFLLYLGRMPVPEGLPQRGSVGDRFFSQGRSLSLIKALKQKLGNAAEVYQNLASQEPKDSTAPSNQTLYHTLTRSYRGMSYWLDEPRLHSPSLYLPSLPQQYERELLEKIFQYDSTSWSHLIDWPYLDDEMNALVNNWKDFFSPKVVHKNISPSRETNPTNRILNRLNSVDLPLPPPSVEQIKPPVAELPPTLICDKQNLIHSLRADFESLSGYAKVYDARTQKHVALNCSLLEMLPELYKPRTVEATVSITCKSMINPLHKCKGPAAANVTYDGTVRDEIMSRKINENRAEYKQVLIESILPPSQHLCSSAVHVETTITELVKLYKQEKTESNAELQDVGCTLFYNVAAYVSEVTKYYPPTRQFFSFCLEVLGQEFIRNNPGQAQPLLQTILQNPILVNMMAPNFSPNASPELFITMYEDLIPVPVNQGPDVALTLLTKFNVNEWMDNSLVGLPQRQMLLGVISRALCQCGQRPAKQTKTVCEIYKNNLIDIFEYRFPEVYKDFLHILLSGGSSGALLVQVWEDFVQSLFSDVDSGRKTSPPPVEQINVDTSPTTSRTRIHRLSFQQIAESLDILYVHFHQLRLGSMSSHGLYPRWRAYIEPLSIFMNTISRRFIQWNLKWIKTKEATYSKVVPEIWKMLRKLVRPWLESYNFQEGPQSPWLQADIEPASVIVRLWVTSITLLHGEVKGYNCGTSSSPLSLLWSWYVECMSEVDVPSHVLSVVQNHLIDAPWVEFVPTLIDLQNFNVVLSKGKAQCIDFITGLVCVIPWAQYYKEVLAPKLVELEFPTSVAFHVQLFYLFVTLPVRTKCKESELADIVSSLEICQWDIVDAQNFQHTAEAYVRFCDPTCVVAQRTHPSVMPLKLLRKASTFTATVENESLHPETPVKRVIFVKSFVELLCKCGDDVKDEPLQVAFSNLITDVEAVITTVTNPTEQKQSGLTLCKELIGIMNLCKREKAPLFLTTLLEWIDNSSTSVLLPLLISAACRSLVHIPYMLQVTEMCIDSHFIGAETKLGNWGIILASLQVPELNLQEFINESISQGSFLTLYAHILQQLPLSQKLEDELVYVKTFVTWTSEVKPIPSNEHKLLVWWWHVLKLCERQVVYVGPLGVVGATLRGFIVTLWSLGEDKESAGFLGAIGLGKRSPLSTKFRVVCKCLAAFLAAQLASNDIPRIKTTDPVIIKKASTPDDNKNKSPSTSPTTPTPPPVPPVSKKDSQRHVKTTKQYISHISMLPVYNKQYQDYKSQLQYALEFTYVPSNTLMQASVLLKFFIEQLYSDKACFCDVLHS